MPDISTRRKKVNPYSAITYHKDYVHDKIKYTVLAADQMPKDIVELVQAKVSTLATGGDVIRYIWHNEGHKQGWSYQLDAAGRVGVLAFRGTEVALYYKRQVVEIIPAPGEPLPEHRLDDPEDVWVRVDLFEARKGNVGLKKVHTGITSAGKVKDQILVVQESRISALESQSNKMSLELDIQKKHADILKAHNSLFRKALGANRVKKVLAEYQREQERLRKIKARREERVRKLQREYEAREAKKRAQKEKRLKKKGTKKWTPADLRAKTPQRQAAIKAKSKGRK